MNEHGNSDRVENSEQIEGTKVPDASRILTLVTIDTIFDMFTVHRRTVWEICKCLGIRKEHVEYALRCKLIHLREAGLPRNGYGRPVQRAVVSMPSRVRGEAA